MVDLLDADDRIKGVLAVEGAGQHNPDADCQACQEGGADWVRGEGWRERHVIWGINPLINELIILFKTNQPPLKRISLTLGQT